MKLYKTLSLSASQLEEIYSSLGGKYSLWERLKRKRIGSPRMFYSKGNEEIDALQALASNEILINIELLKEGVLFRIAERTNTYFIPFRKKEIKSIELIREDQQILVEFKTIEATLSLWGNLDYYSGWKVFIKELNI